MIHRLDGRYGGFEWADHTLWRFGSGLMPASRRLLAPDSGGPVPGFGEVRQRHGHSEARDWWACAPGAGQRRRPRQTRGRESLNPQADDREARPDLGRPGDRAGGAPRHHHSSRLGLAAAARPRPDTQKKIFKPSSRSGQRFARRARYGSRGASPSCATSCRAWGSLMKPR